MEQSQGSPKSGRSRAKRAKETSRQSEARLKLMLESVTDGVVVTDLKGVVIEANEKAVELAGVSSKNELLGRSPFDFITPLEHERLIMSMQETLAGGSTQGYEYTILRADGSEFIGGVSSNLLKDASGKPIGFIVIARDITERKRVEQALRESEQKYRSLVEHTDAGIASIDLQGKVTFVNNGLCTMIGYSERELLGQPFASFLHPDDKERLRELFQRALSSPAQVYLEFRVIHKKGHTVHMGASPTSIVYDDQIVGFNAIVHDITRLKHTEAKLLDYQKGLRSLASQLALAEERERRRIAVEVHDRISQTLALCRMKLGALIDAEPSTQLTEPLSEIQSLLKQLVEETRSLTFELSSPLLYELGLEAAVERLTEQMKEQNNAVFSFEDDRQPKPLDEDIRVLLFQTVRELLINIAKHAQARSAGVNFSRQGEHIKIVVEDDGIGFDASQFGSGRKRTTGFGLFSIRERLHLIGGQMKIESQPGRGTRVTILAPLKQNNKAKEPA